MIRVLLCDDHRIVREGLKQVLADDPYGLYYRMTDAVGVR